MENYSLEFDLTEGSRLREAGKKLAVSKRAYLFSLARSLAINIAKVSADRTTNADEVYRQLSLLGHDSSLLGNSAGSLFRGVRWRFTGRRIRSHRVSNHGRLIMVWELT